MFTKKEKISYARGFRKGVKLSNQKCSIKKRYDRNKDGNLVRAIMGDQDYFHPKEVMIQGKNGKLVRKKYQATKDVPTLVLKNKIRVNKYHGIDENSDEYIALHCEDYKSPKNMAKQERYNDSHNARTRTDDDFYNKFIKNNPKYNDDISWSNHYAKHEPK